MGNLLDLERLVDFVVSKYKPEKIILFGSYATKNGRKSFDIDLLIIKETNKRVQRRSIVPSSG